MTIMLAGELAPRVRHRLAAALEAANVPVQHCATLDGARQRLSAEPLPVAVITHVEANGAKRFLGWMRDQLRFLHVAALVVVDWPSEEEYARALALGADDVVLDSDIAGTVRRCAMLIQRGPVHDRPPAAPNGLCVVQHPDQARRAATGRALRQAGFDVMFATKVAEVLEQVRQAKPAMVILAEQTVWQEADDAVKRVRANAASPSLPCVICVSDTDARQLRGSATAIPNIALMQDGASPTDALFLVNRLLMSSSPSNLRASPRTLHQALCSFRTSAKDAELQHGVTYNVSRGGVYVRTLDPPASGERVTVKLRPPGRAGTMELVGRVAWVARPVLGATVAAPPGFGVELLRSECLEGEWQRYQAAMALADEEVMTEASFAHSPRSGVFEIALGAASLGAAPLGATP